MKKISTMLVLMMVFTVAIGLIGVDVSYAAGGGTQTNNLIKDAFNNVANGTGSGANNSVLGQQTKDKVNGLSQDVIDILSTIAMTVLIASCIWTATKISTVGDNAQKKMAVKGAVLLQIAGIIYLANIISFIDFSFSNFKIF